MVAGYQQFSKVWPPKIQTNQKATKGKTHNAVGTPACCAPAWPSSSTTKNDFEVDDNPAKPAPTANPHSTQSNCPAATQISPINPKLCCGHGWLSRNRMSRTTGTTSDEIGPPPRTLAPTKVTRQWHQAPYSIVEADWSHAPMNVLLAQETIAPIRSTGAWQRAKPAEELQARLKAKGLVGGASAPKQKPGPAKAISSTEPCANR